ncbi:prolactin-7D1-like isoform X1 [Peromyscus maniculatus bairdii]|uniref:prolactin-7D1-like isoform X1 n=1 Tax=Peromyscus maniculatus bairdii TaxID=230844 RepID=UPI00042AC95C
MPLSLTQTCSSGTLLMLLVSNLLLWEKVASAPMNVSEAGLSKVSLKDLFDNATALAENITELATEMRLEFFHDKFSSEIFNKIILDLSKKNKMAELVNSCHTLPIKTPDTKEEVRNTTIEGFLKLTLSILHAWKDPLKHLVAELSAMPEAPHVILSKAKAIEAQHKIFLEEIVRIVSKVNPAIKETEDPPVWSDLESLRAADEEIRFFALYLFSYCLRLDLRIVEFYVNILKCIFINGDICYTYFEPLMNF